MTDEELVATAGQVMARMNSDLHISPGEIGLVLLAMMHLYDQYIEDTQPAVLARWRGCVAKAIKHE